MNKGFLQISRDKMADFEWLDNPVVFYVFVRLLLMANYQDKLWRGMLVQRGQLITGLSPLSNELNLSVKQIRTALDKLEKGRHIGRLKGNQFTVVTICNYDSWVCVGQTEGNPVGNPKDTESANEGQAKGSNLNKESKDNKDIKKEDTYVSEKEKELELKVSELEEKLKQLQSENESKKHSSKFIPPTLEEVKTYVAEKGLHFDAERFFSYYESNGWVVGKSKMKKWKAACATWETKWKEQNPQYANNDLFNQVQFPANPRHGDRIGYDWFYDAEEERWIKDKETDRLGREFNVELGKWLI